MAQANNNTARLRWRCRRGTREMDLLLLRFLEQDYPRLNSREQSLFGSLLDEADPDIYAWITGQAQPANPDYLPLIGKISPIAHHPPLYGKGANSVVPDTNGQLSGIHEQRRTGHGIVRYPRAASYRTGISTSRTPDTIVRYPRAASSYRTRIPDRDCPVSRDKDVNEHEATQ